MKRISNLSHRADFRLLYWLGVFCSLFLSACKEDEEGGLKKVHDPNQPIVLSSFSPMEGGARDKILLSGGNFGSDASKIKVYFNNAPASVVSSSGERIYAIVPRLPGKDPRISVVIEGDSVVYDESFTYHTQAQVTTVTGNGEQAFKAGALSEAQVYCRYLELDAEGNLFFSWRDGGSYGVGRINEEQNIVTPLIVAESSGERILYANGLSVDRATGMVTAAHESVKEVLFTFDPREAWYPRQKNIKFTDEELGSIVTGDRFNNFVSFCPWDGMLYTRFRDGRFARIDPETMEGDILHVGPPDGDGAGPYGSQYGQAINPKKPWLLYFTLHSNARPSTYRQGILVLDLRDPGAGVKRLNAPGGSGFRDGPLEEAIFNYPKGIKFDNDGNMFVADYNNSCIRMVSADNIVTTVAGQPGVAGYQDGGPIESLFNHPWGVAVNEQGDIYIADRGNARIRKLVIE